MGERFGDPVARPVEPEAEGRVIDRRDGPDDFVITHAYRGFEIDTDGGQRIGVCSRDGGVEVSIDGEWVWSSTELPNPRARVEELERLLAETREEAEDMREETEGHTGAEMGTFSWEKKEVSGG